MFDFLGKAIIKKQIISSAISPILTNEVKTNSMAAGRKIGDVIAFELSRPTGDGFTGNAFLHSIGVHYQIDTLGSRQMSVK